VIKSQQKNERIEAETASYAAWAHEEQDKLTKVVNKRW